MTENSKITIVFSFQHNIKFSFLIFILILIYNFQCIVNKLFMEQVVYL